MAINFDDAFEVSENGVAMTSQSGDVVLYFTGGTGVPLASAPANSVYLDRATQIMYFNTAQGSNWRQLRSQDMTFDPSGLPAFIASDNTVFKALQRLGNQTIEDLAEIESFASVSQETTTSNGWVSKSGFPWTSASKSAGVYSIRWYYEVGQTKASRNFGYRTLVTSPTTQTLSEVAISGVSNDNQTTQQGGFQSYSLMSDGPITVNIQHGQTTDGFASIIKNAIVEIRRTGDLP